MPTRPTLKFPKQFLWGVSTSAHQVEGGNHNQWSVWELENAKALAAQAPYQYGDLDNWGGIKAVAKDPANYVSGDAMDHFRRYEADFDLAQKMHLNAWRFSVEWSRVQPDEGAWDVAAVQYYKDYIAALRKRGLEPIMTLFHFTLPVWFAEKGGFSRRANVRYFTQFVERIISELGTHVKYVITINEPEIYAVESYKKGHWPPAHVNAREALRVQRNLAVAHNRAADIIHAKNRRFKVSVAKNCQFVYPGDDAWLSVRAAAIKQYFADDWFLGKVVKKCDFIGVNYYFSSRVYGYREHNPNETLSDLGWDMQPENLAHVLERLYDKYKKPLMITENGLADASDEHRKWWLTQSIVAMQQAVEKGVEVLGYLHWSLFDNFEWDKGFWPKFGLFSVEPGTFRRLPRPSALYYAKVIKKVRGL